MSYTSSKTIEKEQARLQLMSVLSKDLVGKMLGEAKKRLGRGRINILDAGCGTGEDFSRLAGAFPRARITGLDISPEALARAREKRIARELIQEDIRKFEQKETFDLIFIKAVLMHLSHPERALAKLRESLRGGGVLVVFEPDYQGMRGDFPEFHQFMERIVATMRRFGIDPFTGGRLKLLAEEAGYIKIKELAVTLEISPKSKEWEILFALCEVAGPAMAGVIPLLEKARQNKDNILRFQGKMAIVATNPAPITA